MEDSKVMWKGRALDWEALKKQRELDQEQNGLQHEERMMDLETQQNEFLFNQEERKIEGGSREKEWIE